MKSLKYILIILILSYSFNSCNEDKILEEIPVDFYSPENAYSQPEGIELAIFGLYENLRGTFVDQRYSTWYYYREESLQYATDYGMDGIEAGFANGLGNFKTSLTPGSPIVLYWWENMYKIISESNTIIERIAEVTYPSEESKNAALAEAMFFRAYAYRFLAYLYGGVPLVLEEVSAKRDFVRATRKEVYNQCIADLKFATEYLPGINEVKADGRVSKEAAFHYLAEIYLATEEWDNSINAASQVINNPAFHLMNERFGTRASEPGDVYWDLFRRGNQNRGSGNMEAIWVRQDEFKTEGGGAGSRHEKYWGPAYFVIPDPDGNNGFIGPTTQNGGRPNGIYKPTYHASDSIWVSDWDNDIRNSKFNIKRKEDWIYDNPASAYYGKSLTEFPPKWESSGLPEERLMFPYFMKFTTPENHPEEWVDPETGLMLNSYGGRVRDDYYARLAETYLIRAEAYLGKGDKTNAAADINMVRERANATPVSPADVDIDYILDERIRELAGEEIRRLTLVRMGKWYERTLKYNKGPYEITFEPYHELFPIPLSEIERNTGAVLEQNPGYN